MHEARWPGTGSNRRPSDSCQLLALFVVTPHCKNSNDPVRLQHLVDEAMLKIDAP